MKFRCILLCLFLLVGSVLADDPANVVVPYILKAPAPIVIDGDLKDFSFAFPLNFNQKTMRDYMRAVDEGWVVTDDTNCSGTIYMMYDDEYLYVAAEVIDDAPGHFSDAEWAADAIEFYMANWDIGDALRGADSTVGWVDDVNTGQYSFQLNISFDESLDSVIIRTYYGPPAIIESENTEVNYFITDDGYILEGKIYLEDLTSVTTGNFFQFEGGTRIPISWSIYDIDESEASGDFKGYNYNTAGFAGWMGVSEGWQVLDVLETPRGEVWNNGDGFDFVAPYIKKADEAPEIDGDLSDWNFCFPVSMNTAVMGDSFRCVNDGWVVTDDLNCSGVLYMMYDQDYFYFAANVIDDAPGHFSDAEWAADAIEYYMANWNVGNKTVPTDTVMGWLDDVETGDYCFQLNVSFDESQDETIARGYYGPPSIIESENSTATYQITYSGYTLEGKIFIDDLSSTTTGNYFEFIEGQRLPFTWSLYDIDESEASGDFKGFAYQKKGFAGWMGVSPGWQYADVKGIDFISYTETQVGVKENNTKQPMSFELGSYPNPFNPCTNIQYSLNNSGNVTLKVYDINGRLVQTVINNQVRQAGLHVENVNLSNQASGVYIAVLQQGNVKLSHKMLLVK